MTRPVAETFHWSAIAERLAPLAEAGDFTLDAHGRAFESNELRIHPPLVVPVPESGPRDDETARTRAARLWSLKHEGAPLHDDPLDRYVRRAPLFLPTQCLIVLQAGAASLGYFKDGEPLSTKTIKRYVVRGKGRAQPTYLAAKGKSRYGSRLRLQNARLLIDEINAKLAQYWSEYGAPEQIFAAAPARLWSDLFRGHSQPPFSQSEHIHRVPLDLPTPTTDVLLRAYKTLCYGRIESRE